MGRILESAGTHVMMDAFVEDPAVFDKELLTSLFHDLVSALEMKILVGPDFVEVPTDPEILKRVSETGRFEDEGGITGTCVISKSHISLHAWPLRSFFSFDAFSCEDFDPDIVFTMVRDRLRVSKESVHVLNRTFPVHVAPSVYCVTNKINGKRYIGKSKDPTARWGQHVWTSRHPEHHTYSVIHAAIAKYGVENFLFEVLGLYETDEEAYAAECKWIAHYKSNQRSHGYNLNEGGIGGPNPSEEVRAKISRGNKGKTAGEKSPMWGRKGAAHPCFGRKQSQEIKDRLSESRKGAGNPMYGKRMSAEQRALKSVAWRGEGNPRQPMYTVEDVDRVKKLRAMGATQRMISEQLGIAQSLVSKMLRGLYRPRVSSQNSHVTDS